MTIAGVVPDVVQMGVLAVVAGPSGVGKGTVIAALLNDLPRARVSVSATTRAPREGEVDGEHYHFVSPERFAAMADEGALLEWATYAGRSYGTPSGPVRELLAHGHDVLLDIEVQGAMQVRAHAADAVLIFLMPPDDAELERRLRGRGTEDEERVQVRLATARDEMAQRDAFDHVLINEDVQATAMAVHALLDGYRRDRAAR